MKQKMARYEMHKYWGKKPSKDLNELLDKYTNPGDIVLDPFSGYGVFLCEAYLNNRNAIGNDLNPASCFIQEQLLNSEIDLDSFKKEMNRVVNENEQYNNYWFLDECPKCLKPATIVATLRSKDNTPMMNKIKCSCSKSAIEYSLTEKSKSSLINKENSAREIDHPTSRLIRNGRISAFDDMTTDDLFTKRTLICHSHLFKSINNIQDTNIRNLAKLAFTSNLANCSKLVPPIKSRGPMAPGAWMTGFYVGETYLEQNVFHYFKNRINKVIAGKSDFLNNLSSSSIKDIGRATNFDQLNKKSKGYIVTNQDTKNLNIPDNSIDYVFTDPPYGDSVPYFEQSALWNTWLNLPVDYENEVVISDSKERNKKTDSYTKDISECIKEIYRVLKINSYFSITFHSISGSEWYALTKSCLESGFSIYELSWLTQKTFAPRQLNRKKTVKGDVLITFKKSSTKPKIRAASQTESKKLVYDEAFKLLSKSKTNTNDIFLAVMRKVFSDHIIISEINFIEVLNDSFYIDDNGYWHVA